MNKMKVVILAISCIFIAACQLTQQHSPPVKDTEVKETEVNETEAKETEGKKVVQDNPAPVYVNEDYKDPTENLPEGGGMCGGTRLEFLEKYNYRLHDIPKKLNHIVGSAKIDEWLQQFKSYGGQRDDDELNFGSIIRELNIPREEVEKSGMEYRKEELDALYSNNQAEINRLFGRDYALLANGQLYTADWLATRTLSDYKKYGISLEALNEYLKKIEHTDLNEEYLAIKSNLKKAQSLSIGLKLEGLDESSKWELSAMYRSEYYGIPHFVTGLVNPIVLENWENQFVYRAGNINSLRKMLELNVINLVRELNIDKQDFIKANKGLIYTNEQIDAIYSANPKQVMKAFGNPYALFVGDRVISIEWLAMNDVEAYKKAGITKDVLKAYIDKLSNNSLFERESADIIREYNLY